MQVTHKQMNQAAFALFAKQVAEYDIPAAAAEIEWDSDPRLRKFWRSQVQVVLDALAVEVRAV